MEKSYYSILSLLLYVCLPHLLIESTPGEGGTIGIANEFIIAPPKLKMEIDMSPIVGENFLLFFHSLCFMQFTPKLEQKYIY